MRVYIARESDGELWMFSSRPHKHRGEWSVGDRGGYASLWMIDGKVFEKIKWTDEQPHEADLFLK